MDIDKIQFGQLSQLKGIDKVFEDFDVNGDGKISSADESSATNADVKSAIHSLLNSVDEDECVTILDSDLDIEDTASVKKFAKDISNEMSNYYKNGGDFNGDGQITYDDVEYIANKYNFAEVEKIAKKIASKNRWDIYANDNEYKTYVAYGKYRQLINAVKGKSDKNIKKKIKNTANGKTNKGITVSDMIAYYDKITSMSDSAFKAMFGTGTGYSNILKEMATALSTSASTANATPEELSRLKEIYSELSSGKGKLADILKRTMKVSDKSDVAMAKRLHQWINVFSSVIKHTENNKDIVDKISSQLQDGDIPEGKSVTFNLDSGEKFVKSKEAYIEMKKSSFDSSLYKKMAWDDSFKFDDLKYSVNESTGSVTATCYYNGKCVYSASSESYSEYKDRMKSQNLVTITNIGGKYMYSVEDTEETASGKQNKGNLNITDAQIDAVMSALKGTGILNNIYSGGFSNDPSVFNKILSVLNASQIGTSSDYTFTNELGYSSKIWTCSCVGCEQALAEKFVKIINAKLLLEAAKNQASSNN